MPFISELLTKGNNVSLNAFKPQINTGVQLISNDVKFHGYFCNSNVTFVLKHYESGRETTNNVFSESERFNLLNYIEEQIVDGKINTHSGVEFIVESYITAAVGFF
ncbi:MAG: hypothetical protein K0B07_02710 [DPANN group archaeon]|nr:hypothetical protein [DPANN group archaeon]